MIIGFDSYFLAAGARGLGRFATALAQNLPGAVLLSKNSRFFSKGSTRMFPLWEQIALPILAWRQKVNCVILPYNTAPLILAFGVKRVLVVHDLIYMDERWIIKGPLTQTVGRIYRKVFAPLAIRKADLLVTVSEYSRTLISRRFNIPVSQIFLLPNSYDKKFGSGLKETRDKNLIFTVAGEAPSKNLTFLIDVFYQLLKINSNLKLVIAGVSIKGRDKFLAQTDELGISSRVEILPKVTDEYMTKMYATCEVFVCASLMEGFGIPLLEAMASGANLCASDATSLPEVCGEAADYFSPTSVESAIAVISNALNVGLTEKKRAAALKQCEFYSNSMFTQRSAELMRLIESL